MSKALDDRERYPGVCRICSSAYFNVLVLTGGDVLQLFCQGTEDETSLTIAGRSVPAGETPPAWCPSGLGSDLVSDEGPVSDDESEDISETDSLAMILYMLFGPNAGEEIKDGGYIRYFVGGTAPGILEQIDKRLVRLEEKLGLAPIEFIVGDEDDEVDGGSPA